MIGTRCGCLAEAEKGDNSACSGLQSDADLCILDFKGKQYNVGSREGRFCFQKQFETIPILPKPQQACRCVLP